jgi:hypothetical protein
VVLDYQAPNFKLGEARYKRECSFIRAKNGPSEYKTTYYELLMIGYFPRIFFNQIFGLHVLKRKSKNCNLLSEIVILHKVIQIYFKLNVHYYRLFLYWHQTLQMFWHYLIMPQQPMTCQPVFPVVPELRDSAFFSPPTQESYL